MGEAVWLFGSYICAMTMEEAQPPQRDPQAGSDASRSNRPEVVQLEDLISDDFGQSLRAREADFRRSCWAQMRSHSDRQRPTAIFCAA